MDAPAPRDEAPVAVRDVDRMFVNDFPFACRSDDGRAEGVAGIPAELRPPGSASVRPAALATLADVIGGRLVQDVSAPRLALTLDIDTRLLAGSVGPELAMTASMVKAGASTLVSEVEFREPGGGRPVAVSQLTFVRSPRPQDLAPPAVGAMATSGSMPVPWPEHVGARVVGPGVVEIDRNPFVTQMSGTLQGGIVALLGELAAESLCGRPVRDLQVRYLATVRAGPARTAAAVLGGGVVRVEVRDAGRADRLAALALCRMEPA